VTYVFPLAFALTALAALLLPTPADRLRGALGLPAFALGAASAPLIPASLGSDPTVWVTGALLLLAPALLLAAALRARARLAPRGLSLVALVLSVSAASYAAWPTIRTGGIQLILLAAAALVSYVLLNWVIVKGVGLGRAVRWLDARIAPRRARVDGPAPGPDGRTGWFLAAGLLAALFGPYLSLVFLGAVIVAVVGQLRGRRLGTAGSVPVLWIAVPILAAAWWLAVTVAGPDGQTLAALPDAPFSAQAELLLSTAVSVSGALFLGLWPLHGVLPGGGIALVAGALLLRMGWPGWPLGMEHWQPLTVALGVVSAWWAVPTRRVPLAVAGLAFAACFSAPAASAGAWLLVGAAALYGRLPARLSVVLLAAGGYMVTAPLLGAQVVYTVLLAGAATAMLAALVAEAERP
jgi:hypothetical protein